MNTEMLTEAIRLAKRAQSVQEDCFQVAERSFDESDVVDQPKGLPYDPREELRGLIERAFTTQLELRTFLEGRL